jgi:coenzyme F420-0:L-glutamate ligase/coenzyme F420-1:gamma-L-glutamate ligase
MAHTTEVRIIPVPCAAAIKPGDAIASTLLASLQSSRQNLRPGDILVVKHKIISKSEGKIVDLNTIRPSPATRAWARRYGLDPRVTALAASQASRIVRRKGKVVITETRHGFICANSGVDVSNVDGGRHALLLPDDPDLSAARLHREIKKRLGIFVPVIITDSFGRAWREGLTEVAIGLAGMKALDDYRGRVDPHGYELHSTVDAVADELACSAGLVCGKLARTPFCIIRGFRYPAGRGRARDLLRPAANDLFR